MKKKLLIEMVKTFCMLGVTEITIGAPKENFINENLMDDICEDDESFTYEKYGNLIHAKGEIAVNYLQHKAVGLLDPTE